jgi:hypothetical protein
VESVFAGNPVNSKIEIHRECHWENRGLAVIHGAPGAMLPTRFPMTSWNLLNVFLEARPPVDSDAPLKPRTGVSKSGAKFTLTILDKRSTVQLIERPTTELAEHLSVCRDVALFHGKRAVEAGLLSAVREGNLFLFNRCRTKV